MNAKPIPMTSENLQATREGRKVQTRRLMNPQPKLVTGSGKRVYHDKDFKKSWEDISGTMEGSGYSDAPYKPGQILYTPETHYLWGHWEKNGATPKGNQKWEFVPFEDAPENIKYDPPKVFKISRDKEKPYQNAWYKRNARFMPKKYARTFIEVESVRAEQLDKISEVDAIKEGIEWSENPKGWKNYLPGHSSVWKPEFAIKSFETLWQSIHGPESWGSHWVWVVTYKLVNFAPK